MDTAAPVAYLSSVEKRTALATLLLLSLLQIGLAASSMRQDSATADEGAHIAAGWLKLAEGSLDFYREQQPLINVLSALPLVATGHELPPPAADVSYWSVGAEYLFRSGYDSQRMLVLARLPILALLALLPWLGYAFVARETGDRRWGIAAFCLLAFCPNLLAHGRLATVDLGATFFCFLSAVLLIRVCERPSMPAAVAYGSATAAGILSKTSALILLPYATLVAAIALVLRKASRRQLLFSFATAALACVVAVELLILGLAGEAYVARQFPGLQNPFARLTLPFREMAANVAMIRDWYSGSPVKVQYLLGRFSEDGWWYYYPVALYLKLTIPSLLIVVTGVAALIKRRATFGAVMVLLFAGSFLAAAMAGDLALGIRYVLPILPFLYTGSIIMLSRTAGRRMILVITLLIGWHVVEAMVAHPSYVGYFNQTIGSHRNADRYLIDSNLDWGQDLRRLDQWCRRQGIDRIAVHYFGGGDPAFDMTVGVVPVTALTDPIPQGAYFALSRHFYRISYWRALSPRTWGEVLAERNARYVTTVGDSILVYRMDE